MKIITGVGENDHVTANDFRKLFAGIFGPGNYILETGDKFATELVSNNELYIGTGVMCCGGHLSAEVEGATVNIANGTQGMRRIDYVVRRYTKNDSTKIEKDEWRYLIGTPDASNPVAPQYTKGNILEGDLIADCPVIQLTLNGLNVESVKCLLPIVEGVSSSADILKKIGLTEKIEISPYAGSSYYDMEIIENESYYYPGLGIAVINVHAKQTYKKASSVNYEDLVRFGTANIQPAIGKAPITVYLDGNYTRRYSGKIAEDGLITARTNTSYNPNKGSVYNYYISAVYTIKKEG